MLTAGRVYLVGLGPGDPGLITVKGKQIIEMADVVVYDHLDDPQVLSWCRPDCEKITTGIQRSSKNHDREKVVNLMIERALSGKIIARLKNGDPFLFGRGAEELLTLQTAGVNFEVISGVTSALAAPAYAGIPLSFRRISAAVGLFILSQDSLASLQWDKLAGSLKTLVFLRGVEIIPQIVKNLLENGWPESTPVALIQRGTQLRQVVVSGKLADIVPLTAALEVKAPSIIVVGEVVKFREQLSWFPAGPLTGRRILVTRAAHQAKELGAILTAAGAWPITLPTIKIQPLPKTPALNDALANLSRFDWLVFSSANAVDYFRKNLHNNGKDVRELLGLKIICVGSATAKKVEEWGLKIDLVPKDFHAEGIIAELKKIDISGQRFLLPRAKKAREILPNTIRELQGEVVVAPLYETVKNAESAQLIRELLQAGKLDVVTFTSSSTVEHFMALVGEEKGKLNEVKIAVIGPVTRKTVEKLGLKVDIMPQTSTTEELVKAIENYYDGKNQTSKRVLS